MGLPPVSAGPMWLVPAACIALSFVCRRGSSVRMDLSRPVHDHIVGDLACRRADDRCISCGHTMPSLGM